MKTAEWMCTSCGATNRVLVADNEESIRDKCVRCRKRHFVEEDERPVRWRSKAK